MLQEGDKFRRKSDGKIFVLKAIVKEQLILETQDGSHQIMTGTVLLRSSFNKLENSDK